MKKEVLPISRSSSSSFPKWLRRTLPQGGGCFQTGAILEKYETDTVCEQAKCPNRLSCYGNKTATFLALGKACTRSCGFCDIDFAKNPLPIRTDEPSRIALSVRDLGLKHVVITMVARDDLEDGGADALVKVVLEVRRVNPGVSVELLTSDFSGNIPALSHLLSVKPEIFNHNLETVQRLSPRIRHKASYRTSLLILQQAKKAKRALFVKSGLMLGLGEDSSEVEEALRHLRHVGVDLLTLGQYLQASPKKLRVKQFIPPEKFAAYKAYALSLGFLHVHAAPFVRSSLNAREVYQEIAPKMR
ncbi:MAG: lipoyl synthase [Chlamydiota bacterium]